jgi:hypothetical protein
MVGEDHRTHAEGQRNREPPLIADEAQRSGHEGPEGEHAARDRSRRTVAKTGADGKPSDL